jgi:serine/threonine protein kinase
MAGTEAVEPRLNDPNARVGTVVDKYTLIRVLGRGGMGAVYEARHATLARRFAIKFLLPELATNREILRRFENEAKAAGGLEHPNVAAVTDFGRADDGAPYIVMEFLQGEDCAALLKRVGPLPVPRATDIVLQACRGLAVAHRMGIVHRDLKPENLFITDAGDGSDLVKVLDFGIAKLRVSDASVVTGTGATFGTAFYMSPEQARGAGEVDGRTDVWSLGVVLYELLSGRKPFMGEQFLQVIHQILSVEPPALTTLRPGLPPGLLAVVERTMAKELPRRVPSALALAEALAPLAGRRAPIEREAPEAAMAATAATPETITGSPPAPPNRAASSVPARTPTKRRGRVLAIATVTLAAGLGILVLARGRRQGAAETLAPAAFTAGAPAPLAAAPPPTAPGPHAGAPVAPASPAVAAVPIASVHAVPEQKVARPTGGPLRRASEQSGQSSDRRSFRRPERGAVASSPTEPPKSPPPAQTPVPRRPVDIEKDNPYGP